MNIIQTNNLIDNLDDHIQKTMKFSLKHLSEEERPILPDIKIPETTKFSRVEMNEINSKIIRLKSSVVGSISLRKGIDSWRKSINDNDEEIKILRNQNPKDPRIKILKNDNEGSEREIKDILESCRTNKRQMMEYIEFLKKYNIDVKWYEESYENLQEPIVLD